MASSSEKAAAGIRAGIPSGARVCIRQGFYEGLELPIDAPRLVIGRGREADWWLAELTLSRTHAVFGYDAGGFFVQDLGSTNGTFVNGVRTARATLHDGDDLQVGKLQLRVVLPPDRSMASPEGVS